jgi:hypothetical protein
MSKSEDGTENISIFAAALAKISEVKIVTGRN